MNKIFTVLYEDIHPGEETQGILIGVFESHKLALKAILKSPHQGYSYDGFYTIFFSELNSIEEVIEIDSVFVKDKCPQLKNDHKIILEED